MEARELRVGNYAILAETPFDYFQVINGDQIDFADHYMPIPLTEEWLEKFGFDNDDDEYFLGDLELVCVSYNKTWWVRVCETKYEDRGPERHTVYLQDIKHVHQLQNLYFALTGEELTIKQEA